MRENIISSRGYSQNIAGDELSLKIASYPSTAAYLANRLKGKGETVCELCCGIGISLIELAKAFKNVIGVDNDASILDACKRNLRNVPVENSTLLLGDVSSPELLNKIKADVVLYDIPYWSDHNGKVDAKRQNPDLSTLIKNIRQLITHDIVIYAPSHMHYSEIKALVGECEYVQIYINGKYDRNFIFLGGLIEKPGPHKVEV